MNNYDRNIHYLIRRDPGSKPAGLSPDYATQPTVDDLITLSIAYGISVDTLIRKDMSKMNDTPEIRFLVLDVDGVLTDGGMYYTESGDEFKKFNTKDGMAIKGIVKRDIPVGIISSGINENLIQRRADLLGIRYVYVGKDQKLPILQDWCNELNIGINDVAYVGDDINDLAVMDKVGFSACPVDAIEEVKSVVSVILGKKGGEGCVREFIDTYMKG